jgi:hypothetical protein
MPTLALTTSTDAQHRCSALLSALIHPSHQGMQVTRPRCLITASTSLYAPLSIVSLLPMPLWISFAITSDHHSHQSLHIRLPFLLSTFLFILSIPFGIHCLISYTTFQYLSPFSTIFSYTASLSVMPPYAHSFPCSLNSTTNLEHLE